MMMSYLRDALRVRAQVARRGIDFAPTHRRDPPWICDSRGEVDLDSERAVRPGVYLDIARVVGRKSHAGIAHFCRGDPHQAPHQRRGEHPGPRRLRVPGCARCAGCSHARQAAPCLVAAGAARGHHSRLAVSRGGAGACAPSRPQLSPRAARGRRASRRAGGKRGGRHGRARRTTAAAPRCTRRAMRRTCGSVFRRRRPRRHPRRRPAR